MTEPMMKPPTVAIKPVAWMRQNLFSSWYNSLLTLVVAYLVVTSVGPSSAGCFSMPRSWVTSRAIAQAQVPAGFLSMSA